jgi:hypothetical protein
MRALSIRQPWAWAICKAGKDIENRTWKPPSNIIGQTIALHVSKREDLNGYDLLRALNINLGCPRWGQLGKIVGICSITAIITTSDSPWFRGPYGWKIEGLRLLSSPILCSGRLGLWKLPRRVEDKLLYELVTDMEAEITDLEADIINLQQEKTYLIHEIEQRNREIGALQGRAF